MSYEQELFEELRRAKQAVIQAQAEEDDAWSQYKGREKLRRRAEALVEEIMAEVVSGQTGRPLIDAIKAKVEAAREEETPAAPKRGRPRKPSPAVVEGGAE